MAQFIIRILRFHLLENNSGSPSIRYISTIPKEHSFTVSYLMKTLGFSKESAISASKKLKFKNPDQPNSVLTLFRNHGFSESQISKIVKRCPMLLFRDPAKTLLPKLDFFYSKGASPSDLIQLVYSYPSVLTSSLENELVPAFNFLNGLLNSEKEIFRALKRFAGILRVEPVAQNVQVLRENGVPSEKISVLFQRQPRALAINVDSFKESVDEVIKMGFNPEATKFVSAVAALRCMSKSTWEKKVDVYRKWGWSDEDFFLAFKAYPSFMTSSEEKVAGIMDLLVNKLGIRPSAIARYPVVLSLSLKNRIAPRGSVAQLLVSKGLIKKDLNVYAVFCSVEEAFLKSYIYVYKGHVDDLLKFYQEQLDLSR